MVYTGTIESAGVWGSPRPATWRDSLDSVLAIARELGVELEVTTGEDPSFHPGRCAQITILQSGECAGFAGELHPTVSEHWNLPKRSCAAEVDLNMLFANATKSSKAPIFSNFPVAKEDLAFVVSREVTVAEVQETIRESGGQFLESIRLFDVYEGDQIPPTHKSLAFCSSLSR